MPTLLALRGLSKNKGGSFSLTLERGILSLLNARNTYSGGTTILGGTLNIRDDGNLGTPNSTLSLAGGIFQAGDSFALSPDRPIETTCLDAIVDTQGHHLTILGTISGEGGITKIGKGTLQLDGITTYQGGTTCAEGILELNSILCGRLRVTGGVVSGTGMVYGDVAIEKGGIAPGHGIGTLEISGNFAQAAGTTYAVQINSLGESSLIDISGRATISPGSQIEVSSADGRIKRGKTYTILRAAEGVSGIYSSASATGLCSVPSITCDAEHVYLYFKEFAAMVAHPRQKQIAARWDALNYPMDLQYEIIDQLNYLPERDLGMVFDQMSGQQYTHLFLAYENSASLFQRRLDMLLRPLYTQVSLCQTAQNSSPQPWMELNAGRLQVNTHCGAYGFTQNSFMLAAGNQISLSSVWTIGTGAAYQNDQQNFDCVGGKGQQNTVMGALYSLYRPLGGYMSSSLLVGYNVGKMHRPIHIGPRQFTCTGKPKGVLSSAYTEVGKDMALSSWLLQPFVGLEGGYYALHSLSEEGAPALDLDVPFKSHGNASSRLGVHLSHGETPQDVEFGLDLAWHYRLTKPENHLNARFRIYEEHEPIMCIQGVDLSRSSFGGALSAVKKFNDRYVLFLQASGHVWNRSHTYNLLGGVRVVW